MFRIDFECAGDFKSFIKCHDCDGKIESKRFILKVY